MSSTIPECSAERVIPFFNRTPYTEEYVVKTYTLDFLFHLDPHGFAYGRAH